ncbi:hypothetical protein AAVH_36875, partial [Aphelenchoides avenae]
KDGEEEEEEEVHHRLVAFDFESEIHEKINAVKERHSPNYVSVHITCTKCIAEGDWDNFAKTTCAVCGPQKVFKFGAWELPEDETVVTKLLEVLLEKLPRGFHTFAYAHNGGKYDTPFILKAITARGGTMPKITARGNKIIEVRIAKTRHFNAVTIRDSVMLFPMKLAECPETFDLKRNGELIMAKSFFPYRFNRAENYGVRREGLPPMTDYIPETMGKKEKKQFEAWYAEHQHDSFDLCKELGEYCSNDTLILIYALVNFRNTFNELANGADIFSLSCTITSACLRLFRHKFLKKDTLAVVPNNGYLDGRMQSAKALKFLKWFADAHNVRMQHRDTDEGELHVPGPDGWYVDGFIPAAERRKPDFKRCNLLECPYCNDEHPEFLTKDVVIEYLGCAWHGCEKCFPNETTLANGRKSDVEIQRTHDRLSKIERILDCKLLYFQECTVDLEMKYNESMRTFNEQCHDTGPLNPRDGFFGGRTHPTRLYSPPSDTTKKCHKDIVSLYPSVLLKEYPVAHPHVHHFDWREGAVNWTRPEDVTLKGLIKCIVSPPKRLFLPVLPFRDDKRLLFPLCRTCARESRTESAYGLKQCNHTPEQREFVTTTTHFELQEALRRGYVVTRIIETWDYEKMDDTIFAGYIKEFMKIKVEASGWEKNGVDPDDEEAKQAFIDAYAKQGIFIDKEAVKLNPGLRYIAKLCLNSLWGRFAMRSDQDQVELVTDPKRMYELLDSTTKEVMSIVAVNDECLRITWRYKKRFERADSNSNLVVAIFTTSYGRCELYKHMCAVEERMDGPPGSKLAYNDTDSVIYDYVPAPDLPICGNPLREGYLLGEMTDEHINKEIMEFCSGGNKQYGMQLRANDTGEITHKLKIRGITLNDVNANLLPYEKFREMTLDAPFVEPAKMPNDLIMRDKQFGVYTHHSTKGWMPIFRKGNVDLSDERRTIFPPGYVFTPEEFS